jgi:pimeloyl-ACP methyl ester carboxylesterase
VLAAAGYFAVGPNQRGYAAGARPDPTDFDNYRVDKLIGDTQDGVGRGGRRFHFAGHDWRGSLAWIIADRWPERIASLTMLSRPHPAFVRARLEDRSRAAASVASSPGIARFRRRTEAARR